VGLPDGEKWHTMNSEIIIVSVRLAIIYILQVQNLVGLGIANWLGVSSHSSLAVRPTDHADTIT